MCKYCGCTSLQNITISNSVTEIRDLSFYGCTSLQSVTIPNSVTTIGVYAFYLCNSLQSVTIPNSVTTIEYDAFAGCTSLQSIVCTSEVLTIKGDAFYGVVATAYVPAASAALYKALEWGGYITMAYLPDYTRSTQVGDFGTICLPYDYTPVGATLYNIESIEDNTVVLTMVEGNQGQLNTAYIYQATAPEQNFPYVPGQDWEPVSEDVTTGVLTSPAEYSVVPEGSYILQTQNDVQAFYKVDGETYIMPHRAYLTPGSIGSEAAPGLSLAIHEDNQTGIDAVRALTQGSPVIYGLDGRRLSTLQKGLNIVGGVKVLVK